ncbi:MAG: glycosyltransferase [Thermoleophilia bacterium]|nr:glycosyltransferase [Thermoleophilia bacterium]
MTRTIAYFGTYDPSYPRNAVLLAGLRAHGVEVLEVQASLPALDAATLAGAAGVARLAAGAAAAYARLALQHRRRFRPEALVVGYPGHLAMPYARLVAAARGARLVFDPLVSLADTFVGDRGLLRRGSPAALAAAAVDTVAFAAAHLVLADTWAHASYYQHAFGLERVRVAVVPVGALPVEGADGRARPIAPERPLTVVQYGKWSPLHGADVVLEAADRLRDEPLQVVLAGEGQLSAELRATIRRRRLDNVDWLGMRSHDELRRLLLEADVCLGVFGHSEKAGRVVPNKVYDGLACGRPVVTAATPGARELLHDDEDALLVPPGDAAALAAALQRLLDDGERGRLGAAALAVYHRACAPEAVAGRLLEALGGVP